MPIISKGLRGFFAVILMNVFYLRISTVLYILFKNSYCTCRKGTMKSSFPSLTVHNGHRYIPREKVISIELLNISNSNRVVSKKCNSYWRQKPRLRHLHSNLLPVVQRFPPQRANKVYVKLVQKVTYVSHNGLLVMLVAQFPLKSTRKTKRGHDQKSGLEILTLNPLVLCILFVSIHPKVQLWAQV